MKQFTFKILDNDTNSVTDHVVYSPTFYAAIEGVLKSVDIPIINELGFQPNDIDLTSIGYHVGPDYDTDGHWFYMSDEGGSDISFPCRADAANAAFDHYMRNNFPVYQSSCRRIGEQVAWIDPAHESNIQACTVIGKHQDIYSLRSEYGGHIEAFEHELSHPLLVGPFEVPEMPLVQPGLESMRFVHTMKKRWRQLPTSMIVMEYLGTGDPFFGGTADDRVLGMTGLILENSYTPNDVAVFHRIEEAHKASLLIRNRREGSILGVVPSWEPLNTPQATK